MNTLMRRGAMRAAYRSQLPSFALLGRCRRRDVELWARMPKLARRRHWPDVVRAVESFDGEGM
jgi:hypothetical protein